MPNVAQIIKYEGDNSTFIWKHPCEDFNTQTQIIVHESQQAVFYMNGQILDTFESGRYTLELDQWRYQFFIKWQIRFLIKIHRFIAKFIS